MSFQKNINLYHNLLLEYNKETDRLLLILINNIFSILFRICFTLFQIFVIFGISILFVFVFFTIITFFLYNFLFMSSLFEL
jgi:hypothetical protein